jgi:VCBS repeat-containing protein
VTDQFGATSTADLTISITGTNDAPVANGDTNANDAVVESGVDPLNTSFAGDPAAAGNVLTNDTDVDTGNVLTVAAVAGLAGNVGVAVTGIYGLVTIYADGSYAYTLNNADPDTDALAQDAVVTDVFSYTVTDQFGATSTADLTITITGTNDAPVIETAGLQTSSGNGSTTVSGLTVSDADASPAEIFTVTTDTAAAGSSVTNLASGTLAEVNAALNTGFTYDPGLTPPQTDMVSLTVADASGATDTVNFIFNVTDPIQGNAVTLASTSGKDVLFGTGYQDQFVFTANSSHDTIVGFTPGTDHIDLTALSSIVSSATISSFMTTNVTTQGSDILITLDGADTITLRSLLPGSLQAGDFIVHA